jgi:hypothetical protein
MIAHQHEGLVGNLFDSVEVHLHTKQGKEPLGTELNHKIDSLERLIDRILLRHEDRRDPKDAEVKRIDDDKNSQKDRKHPKPMDAAEHRNKNSAQSRKKQENITKHRFIPLLCT